MADDHSTPQPPPAAHQPAASDGAAPRQPWVWPVATVVLVVAFGAACSLLTSGATDSRSTLAPDASRSTLAPDAIFARSSPAVVQVVARDRQGRTFTGSGFLVSRAGLVATNYHVIEKAHAAHVVLPDETELPVLGVAALDRDADLAILKVEGQLGAQPLALAVAGLPPVGARVYAIGNPLGQFANTLINFFSLNLAYRF